MRIKLINISPFRVSSDPDQIALERFAIGARDSAVEAWHVLNGLDHRIVEADCAHFFEAGVMTSETKDSKEPVEAGGGIGPNEPKIKDVCYKKLI